MCQLVWGKIYRFFTLKKAYLIAIVIFEAGSVLCAAAPKSAVLILGRAVAGVGAAGINAGYGIILTRLVPLRSRAMYDTWGSAAYMTASVTAPLIGGALTTKVSWRWCFWINLPCGAVTAIATILFVKVGQGHTQHQLPLSQKLKEFDFLGTCTMMGGFACVLLALQWGGIVYAWNSSVVIALFATGGGLLVMFALLQWRLKEKALIPLRILGQRNIAFTTVYHILMGAGITILEYYLPLWFQAIEGATPLSSGLMLLPIIIAGLVSALAVGSLISWLGYPQPFLVAGAAIFTIGAGLLTTFQPHTERAHWIIFQIFAGVGPGLGLQAALMPVQVVLSDQDVAVGIAVENFGFVLGGALFIPMAQAIFVNRLISGLSRIPRQSARTGAPLSTAGVNQILAQFPKKSRPKAKAAYNEALLLTFWVATATGILSFLVGLGVDPRISVKKKQQ